MSAAPTLEELHKEFGETYALETLTSLERLEVIARLAENGRTRKPFRARTLAPLELRVGKREKLIASSREKYAAPQVKGGEYLSLAEWTH